MRSDRDRLLEIAEIEAIERYAGRGKRAYDADVPVLKHHVRRMLGETDG